MRVSVLMGESGGVLDALHAMSLTDFTENTPSSRTDRCAFSRAYIIHGHADGIDICSYYMQINQFNHFKLN